MQSAAQRASVLVHEARTACYALARLNLCLSAGLVDSELKECIDSLASAGLLAPAYENGHRPDDDTLQRFKDGLMAAWRTKKVSALPHGYLQGPIKQSTYRNYSSFTVLITPLVGLSAFLVPKIFE